MPALGEQAAVWALPVAAIVFLLLAIIETHRPRQPAASAEFRWARNVGLYSLILATGLMVAPQRLAGVILSGWAGGPLTWLYHHEGAWAALVVGLLLLDGLSYALHRMQHLAPFWRFHAIHHTDVVLDSSTALRHHPGEYLVNTAISGLVLVLAGLPNWVVPVYGFVTLLSDLWTHANIALPPRFERALATVFVSPGVHRLHHSSDAASLNTNFGSVLSIWDRIFGTWRAPAASTLRFGVAGVGEQTFLSALIAPFRRARFG